MHQPLCFLHGILTVAQNQGRIRGKVTNLRCSAAFLLATGLLPAMMARLSRSPSLSLLAAAAAAASALSATPPNVLIVLTDDQGWGDTGYNCGQPVRTLCLMLPSVRRLSLSREREPPLSTRRQPQLAQLTAARAGRRAASPTHSATLPHARGRRTSTRSRRARTLCCSTAFTRALASAARLGRAC